MKRFLLALSIAAVFSFPGHADDQSSWDRYKTGTLAEIVKKVEPIAKEHDDGVSAAFESDYPTIVNVEFVGKSRPVSERRKGAISMCAKTAGIDGLSELFKIEYLFREGKTDYWIPVQDQMLTYYKTELTAGQTVDLWVILIGMDHLGKDGDDCLILANDFAPVSR